eukprot:gene10119-11855_t
MNHDRKPTRKSWSAEEDAQLLQLIKKHGTSGCWERYMNHLDPHMKKSAWTPEEDHIIKDLFPKLGTRWSLYMPSIPGRSDNSIKNRYHVIRKNNFECCRGDASTSHTTVPNRKRTHSETSSEDTDADTIGEESHAGTGHAARAHSLRHHSTHQVQEAEEQRLFWGNVPSSPVKSDLSTRCEHEVDEFDSDFEFDFDWADPDAFLASERASQLQYEAAKAEALLQTPFDFTCYDMAR